MLDEIKAIPAPDLYLRKGVDYDPSTDHWVIWANEVDIAKFNPEELEEAIKYMNLIKDKFAAAGLSCRVETARW